MTQNVTFLLKNAAKKIEYFKNNIGNRFLDRKNKNDEIFLTEETTKKYPFMCPPRHIAM